MTRELVVAGGGVVRRASRERAGGRLCARADGRRGGGAHGSVDPWIAGTGSREPGTVPLVRDGRDSRQSCRSVPDSPFPVPSYTFPSMPAPPRVPPVPAVLRLVQTMVLGRWRATGEELYREVADLVEASRARRSSSRAPAKAKRANGLPRRPGASVTGVDPERRAHRTRRDARARAQDAAAALVPAGAALDDLPHESNVFDAALAEPLLSSAARSASARSPSWLV